MNSVILVLTLPTRGLPVSACNTACQIVSLCEPQFLYATHTPARTLVMSRTRIPANGRVGEVGESAVAVARPLQSEHLEPLSRIGGLKYFARCKAVLEVDVLR